MGCFWTDWVGVTEDCSDSGGGGTPVPSPLTGAYTSLAPWQQRYQASMAAAGGLAYSFSGVAESSSPTGDLWVYDPVSDAWAQLASITGPSRSNPTLAAWGGTLVAFGGATSSGKLNDLWVYDIAAGTWQQKTNVPVAQRQGHTACATADGKMLLFGGYLSTLKYSHYLWAYDIAHDSWEQKASGPAIGFHSAVIADDGNMYVFGGSNDTAGSDQLWCYHPANDTWTQKASGPAARREHVSIAIGQWVYVMNGRDADPSANGASLGDLWGYNTISDTWTELVAVAPVGQQQQACAIDGVCYLQGGEGDKNTTSNAAMVAIR